MNAAVTILTVVAPMALVAPKAESKRIAIEELVTADPLPKDFGITHEEIKNGENVLGHSLSLTKEDAVSKAIIKIEDRKLPDRAHKVTAFKGYVNGTTQMFREAGLKLVNKKIPDVEKVDVDKRTVVDLEYETAEGTKLFMQIQVFFSDVGHHVLIVAENKKDLNMLTKWAKSVQPIEKKQDE